MPRSFGRRDVSITWAVCAACDHRHPAHVGCPTPGVWLVLAMCRDCEPRARVYCGAHRAVTR